MLYCNLSILHISETIFTILNFKVKDMINSHFKVVNHDEPRVRKYARFGVFYAKIVQMTLPRLQRESLRLQTFSVSNREPLRLQRVTYDQSLLDDRHHGFELSRSADRHSYFVYPSR